MLPKLLKDLFKPIDLVFRLFEMVLKALAQIAAGGLLDELWQRLDDLFFGVIDVH